MAVTAIRHGVGFAPYDLGSAVLRFDNCVTTTTTTPYVVAPCVREWPQATARSSPSRRLPRTVTTLAPRQYCVPTTHTVLPPTHTVFHTSVAAADPQTLETVRSLGEVVKDEMQKLRGDLLTTMSANVPAHTAASNLLGSLDNVSSLFHDPDVERVEVGFTPVASLVSLTKKQVGDAQEAARALSDAMAARARQDADTTTDRNVYEYEDVRNVNEYEDEEEDESSSRLKLRFNDDENDNIAVPSPRSKSPSSPNYFKPTAAFRQSNSGVRHGKFLKSHEHEHDFENRKPEDSPQPLHKELHPSKLKAHFRLKNGVHRRRRSPGTPARRGNTAPASDEEAEHATCESARRGNRDVGGEFKMLAHDMRHLAGSLGSLEVDGRPHR
mmetsp:Transcript_7383/g.20218  ORF Transcript_7383/g.20218 Transcript_7383/m.20218 type:complete len:383 (-) Transcript_7383:131-1279(-)